MFFFTLVSFIVFGGVDYYVTEVQLNTVEEATNFYLSKMKFEGTLYYIEKESLKDELIKKGFFNVEVNATDGYDNRLDDSFIVVRNTEDLNASTINLEVKAYPSSKPFIFGRLLGSSDVEDFYFKVERRTISEKPAY